MKKTSVHSSLPNARYQAPRCRVTRLQGESPLVASGGYTVNEFKDGGSETLGGDAPSNVKANPVNWNDFHEED